jgi:pimeloyl-ACP methyl ester carboxylesterase
LALGLKADARNVGQGWEWDIAVASQPAGKHGCVKTWSKSVSAGRMRSQSVDATEVGSVSCLMFAQTRSGRRHGRSSGLVAAALLSLALAACYTLDKRDIFEVAFKPVTPAALAQLSDARHHVRALPLNVGGRSVSAYWDDGADASGVLLFFNGNGYGAEAALRRMLTPARALKLDLIVFNYYDEGQPTPSMTEMRAVSQALYTAAAALPTPAARKVYVGGHSLGATFALDLAAEDPIAGAFVAAPATTGVQMIHHQLPYSRLVWLRPDEQYAQFDNLTIARGVRRPVLVVGSEKDESLPPDFTHAVFAAIPAATPKREVILKDSPHSEYFAREQFWQAVSDFFGLPASGPLVGYLRPA